MTYEIEKQKLGRRSFTVVELVLDFCDNVYSVAPCTANLAAGFECYNGFRHCQDQENYIKITKTYRFCSLQKVPAGFNAFPCIKSIKHSPTKVIPGGGLGRRASVTIDLVDFTHDDKGIDPYVATRSYDTSSGSFFGKLYARNPFYSGRTIRVMTGFISEPFDFPTDFITKEYIIDSINRVGGSGRVQIIAKDPIKLTDNDRAQCPLPSSGALASSITDVQTALTLTSGTGSEYGASGHVRINDEIIKFDSRSVDTLNSLTREQYGTTKAAHDADDLVQLCKEFLSVNVTDIIFDLIVNFAGIDAALINTSDWDDIESKWFSLSNFTTIISEPTGVADLLNELIEENLIDVFWEERTQSIEIRGFFPDGVNLAQIEYGDEANIISGSVRLKENSKNRVSQVWVYYAARDYSEVGKKPENFARLKVVADVVIQGENAFNETRIKKMFSRWFDAGSLAVLSQAASRRLFKYKNNVQEANFRLDEKDNNLLLGDHFVLKTRFDQGVTGEAVSHRMVVVSAAARSGKSDYTYEAVDTGLTGRFAFVAAPGVPDYSAATDEQRASMCFVAPATGFFPDSGEAYKVL